MHGFLHDQPIPLLELERRQFLVEAVDEEWPKIVRGKSYVIHDDAAFRALVDVDAMNVIDLCSWVILERVRRHYLDDLAATAPGAQATGVEARGEDR